jgi:hypothetical protein
MKNQNTLVWIVAIIVLILLFLFFFGNRRSCFAKTSNHEDEIENETEEFGGTITHHLRIPRFRQPLPRFRQPRWRVPRFRYPRFPVLPPSSRYHFPSQGKCEQDCRYFPTGYSRWGVPSGYQFRCSTKADGRPSRGCKHELSEPGSTEYDCERQRSVTGQLCMDKID